MVEEEGMQRLRLGSKGSLAGKSRQNLVAGTQFFGRRL